MITLYAPIVGSAPAGRKIADQQPSAPWRAPGIGIAPSRNRGLILYRPTKEG